MAPISQCVGATATSCGGTWDDIRPVVMFIMLNPSTADATADDPTIRRCIGFTHDWGYGGVRVGNLFAWRTPYPQALRSALDPIGRHNDSALCELAEGAALVVAAWGVNGMWLARSQTIRQQFTRPLHALGVTKYRRAGPSAPTCDARARPFCWIVEGGLSRWLLWPAVRPILQSPLDLAGRSSAVLRCHCATIT